MCVVSCGLVIHGKGTAGVQLRHAIGAKIVATSNPVPWRRTGFDATPGRAVRCDGGRPRCEVAGSFRQDGVRLWTSAGLAVSHWRYRPPQRWTMADPRHASATRKKPIPRTIVIVDGVTFLLCTSCGAHKAPDCFVVVKRTGKPFAHCRDCRAKQSRQYRSRNHETVRLKTIAARLSRNGLHKVKGKLKELRGVAVSHEQLQHFIASREPYCECCGVPLDMKQGAYGFNIDHCHKRGVLRGLLCKECNKGLGCFKDDTGVLLKAKEYLARHGKADT